MLLDTFPGAPNIILILFFKMILVSLYWKMSLRQSFSNEILLWLDLTL